MNHESGIMSGIAEMCNGFMFKLTKQQIERQDFVDNQIFELIQQLVPSVKIKWDIEMIGNVRDSISSVVFEKIGGLNERQFYP